ncbi:helix-turn-helix domain-containing protein [Paenibacillus hexagrammi]|uniref:AraC family transcriptional regulator n=1 Tax=Paenibacillus hexagrammi TaxID=2908839 RepID=A0ABY3SLL8_9BACL|nr:AraC family transcriptional regulator [Paenibacillus sp. YPD9-1]UJF34949.1 AraC family transcriptional regulator [Paenibacillus sp. YPD9-1]
MIEGHGAETINGVKHLMSPGTFTFVLPYQVHELFTDPGSTLVLYNCMFSMDLLMEPGADEGLSGLFNEINPLPPFVQLGPHEQIRMVKLLEDMFEEYLGDESWRRTMLQVKLKEILVRFDRVRQTGQQQRTEAAYPMPKLTSIWPIIHYIHRNYQEELSLSELAEQFSMSVSRISEVIKQTTGQSFVYFLHDLRLRHACSLLASTDMSVAEIALEVGYGSYKTFSRIFREIKGVVPKDYRKQKRDDSTSLRHSIKQG